MGAWLAFYTGVTPVPGRSWSAQPYLFGRQVLALDDLSAPLVPTVALLHFLTALATARTHMRRFSFAWSLAAEAIRLATFSCLEPWPLIGLMAASTIPPYVELRNRGRPIRIYVLHMGLFIALLAAGWAAVEAGGRATGPAAWWATLPLLADRLVRACVPRDRPAVRRPAQRRLRRRPAPDAGGAGLGPPEHRPALADHGGLRRRHGDHPSTPATSSPTFT